MLQMQQRNEKVGIMFGVEPNCHDLPPVRNCEVVRPLIKMFSSCHSCRPSVSSNTAFLGYSPSLMMHCNEQVLRWCGSTLGLDAGLAALIQII